jgi:hypothetical protein
LRSRAVNDDIPAVPWKQLLETLDCYLVRSQCVHRKSAKSFRRPCAAALAPRFLDHLRLHLWRQGFLEKPNTAIVTAVAFTTLLISASE